MGIEPTQPAWKAGILPLNYTRRRHAIYYQIYAQLSIEMIEKNVPLIRYFIIYYLSSLLLCLQLEFLTEADYKSEQDLSAFLRFL